MRRVVMVLVLLSPLLPLAASAEMHESAGLYEAHELRLGGIHVHTGYSDGEPGSRPVHAYQAGREAGWDFTAVTEHSEWLGLPVEADDDCLTPHEGDRRFPHECLIDPREDPDGWRKWDAQAETAAAETTPDYLALRGFEWSSPYQGHVVVLHSTHFSNAASDAGATMHGFWDWFTRDVELGGGADGLAIFAHPGREPESFEDFRYVPEADSRVVGVEVYNRRNSHFPGFVQALDAGWHVGAIGAPDRHDDWTRTDYPRTALVIPQGADWEEQTVRDTLLARRTYATFNHNLELRVQADGAEMGSRLTAAPGEAVTISVEAHDPAKNDSIEALELYTNGGELVARVDVDPPSGSATLTYEARFPAGDQAWYVARVVGTDGLRGPARGDAVASPIWLEAEGEWVAGDLHVHTTYSHDAWGGPDDDPRDWDPTDPRPADWFDEFWTMGWTPEEQIRIAEARGLDYLALTDHNDTRSAHDPGFASDRLVLVPGYESSLRGHAQVLGSPWCYTYDDVNEIALQDVGVTQGCDTSYRDDPAAVQRVGDAVRAAGGVYQVNHPAGDMREVRPPVDEPQGWDWKYGFDVVPDSLEVWNIPWPWQPPAPSASSNTDALRYLDAWLDRGHRVAATGGSDNHWRSTAAVQGVGQPTTWIYVTERTLEGILDGIRAGRTYVSHQPPALGGTRAFLESDATGDGVYDTIAGGETRAGATARVRVSGAVPGSWIRVVTSLGEEPLVRVLAPEVTHEFVIPQGATWARAEVFTEDAVEARETHCEPGLDGETTYCRNRIAMLALTSAIYVTP